MKKFPIIGLLLAIGLTGCAGHMYRVEADRSYFYLKKAGVRTVQFACSTDGYTLHPADRIDSRTWRVRVPAEAEFTYFYLVDGQLFLPDCPMREKDDFGTENCIFVPPL